jgi:hypothetical protein
VYANVLNIMKKVISTIRKISLTLLALMFTVLTGSSPMTFAAPAATAAAPATDSGQALEIGPPVINIKGDPGATVKAQLSLRDISNANLIVTNQINDFTANGEDGTPKLLLNQTTPDANSIIKWISPLPQFTLVPKQIQQLPVSIKIPTNAPPGGYYGVIRFTGTPPGLDGTGVSLSASIGALVFVRVNGQAKESMTISDFYTVGDNGVKNWLYEAIPLNFVERLKNGGNLFEKPTGSVVVTDMFGKVVGQQNVNEANGNVLPSTTRRFQQPFNKDVVGTTFMFGRYSAALTVKYGDSGQTVTSTTAFWIIPYRLIAAIIIGLIALGLLLRIYLQNYRKRILGNNRGGGRRR